MVKKAPSVYNQSESSAEDKLWLIYEQLKELEVILSQHDDQLKNLVKLFLSQVWEMLKLVNPAYQAEY